jgi:hypothetical protein
MVSGDLWEQVEGEADLTAVGTAYEQTFAHSPDEEIRKLLFDQRLQSTDSTLEEDDYRKQLSQELALLAMLTGKTVRVEGIDEEVTETFGMSYAACRETTWFEITGTQALVRSPMSLTLWDGSTLINKQRLFPGNDSTTALTLNHLGSDLSALSC